MDALVVNALWHALLLAGILGAAVVGFVKTYKALEDLEKILDRYVDSKVRIVAWAAQRLQRFLRWLGFRRDAGDTSPTPDGSPEPDGGPTSGGGAGSLSKPKYSRLRDNVLKIEREIDEHIKDIAAIWRKFIGALKRNVSPDRSTALISSDLKPVIDRYRFPRLRGYCTALLTGTALSGMITAPVINAAVPSHDETWPRPSMNSAAPQRQILSVSVSGNQRLEPETILSYTNLRPGEAYDNARLDQALRDLLATELLADVQIAGVDTGNLIVQVRENPVINRIVLEGNNRVRDDKMMPEIRLAPRQIFTRSRARADVARIIELYRRQGRYGASVEPQIVQLDQNRVDVVFEINEGSQSRVGRINIIGNEYFDDRHLISEMMTRAYTLNNLCNTYGAYGPDRLAYDQAKLRQFYLAQGYADFRVVSAVAEPTPDRRDFIITYVVEEGQRYRFGDLNVESDIRDFNAEQLRASLTMLPGEYYDAQQVEDTVTWLNDLARLFGYAFPDVRPTFHRDRESLAMGVTFRVAGAPRVYIERIDISGGNAAGNKVTRREFRLADGDTFNNVRVRRSRDRIESLGFFQDDLEIAQTQGSVPGRVVLRVEVDEQATDQLQLSAGFSSLDRFLVNMSVDQRKFMGRGQELRASVDYSSYSKPVELGFTEPYLFDRNVAVGFDAFRRDLDSFNFFGNDRNGTDETAAGDQIRAGVPMTERLSLALRYGLSYDEIGLNKDIFYSDPDGTATQPLAQGSLNAGQFLCDVIGNRLASKIGYSLVYYTLNNRLRPNGSAHAMISADFSGAGGDVRYLRTRINAAKYWNVLGNFIFATQAEGGYLHSVDNALGVDPVRLTDRFYLGAPQSRGFDIRGVGPSIQRLQSTYAMDANKLDRPAHDAAVDGEPNTIFDNAIGGRAYYVSRAELEIPLSASARELGLRPSIYADTGAVFGSRGPNVFDSDPIKPPFIEAAAKPGDVPHVVDGTVLTVRSAKAPFHERFVGNAVSPRVSVGFGVNWNSPFGPFRIDIARALLSEPGDDTNAFTFNVGTAF